MVMAATPAFSLATKTFAPSGGAPVDNRRQKYSVETAVVPSLLILKDTSLIIFAFAADGAVHNPLYGRLGQFSGHDRAKHLVRSVTQNASTH